MNFNSNPIQKQLIRTMKRLGLITMLFISLLSFGEIIQFSAAEKDSIVLTNSTLVVEWESINTTNSMTVVHRNAFDWSLPALGQYKISFLNASPLEFSSSESSTYAKIFLVAKVVDAKSWATLVDAEAGLSVLPNVFATSNDDKFQFYKSSNDYEIYINGEQTTLAPLNHDFIVELSLNESSNLSNVFIGSSPASSEWERSWYGDIYEILFVNQELTVEQYSAIYTYLSIKHKIPISVAPCDNAYAILKGLNVKSGPAFTTMILWR